MYKTEIRVKIEEKDTLTTNFTIYELNKLDEQKFGFGYFE